MVANNLFGLDNKLLICSSFFSSISERSSKFLELSEKKETSEPETIADRKIRINTIIVPITSPIVKSFISTEITVFISTGSGSSAKIYTLKW